MTKPIIKLGSGTSVERTMEYKEIAEDAAITERFTKLAKELKLVAPKADDFIYVQAIMLHAAEATCIDQNTGKPKMLSSGSVAYGKFVEADVPNNPNKAFWKWEGNVPPYSNQNHDVFPELELKKAYMKWIGRPVCVNHKSDDVESVRGIIVDTYYDDVRKRVVGLLAVDKVNHPKLARDVQSGVSHNVSMGTAVGISYCSECGNYAVSPENYCSHVKNARGQILQTGFPVREINCELSPIEISFVVSPADPDAKVKKVIASLNSYIDNKDSFLLKNRFDVEKSVNELENVRQRIGLIQKTRSIDGCYFANDPNSGCHLCKECGILKVAGVNDAGKLSKLFDQIKSATSSEFKAMVGLVDDARLKEQMISAWNAIHGFESSDGLNVEPGYAGQSRPPNGIEFAGGQSAIDDFNPAAATEGQWPGLMKSLANQENKVPKWANFGKKGGDNKDECLLDTELCNLNNKISSMMKEIENIKSDNGVTMEDKTMNEARLRRRAARRREKVAYFQGTEDPKKYELMGDYMKIRDKEDKQMTPQPANLGGQEGMVPGDGELKKKLSRAELDRRAAKRQKIVEAYLQGTEDPKKYELMGDYTKIRDKEDKQMTPNPSDISQDGVLGGSEEENLKKTLKRAKWYGRFIHVKNASGEINKNKSKWQFFSDRPERGGKLVVEASASDIFEDEVEENWDWLSSKEYGEEVIASIMSEGINKVAWALTGKTLVKTAQPPMPPATPAPAAAAPGGAPLPDMGGAPGAAPDMGDPGAPPPMDEGVPPMDGPEDAEKGEDAPADIAKAFDKIEDLIGDLKDAVNDAQDEALGKSAGREDLDKVLSNAAESERKGFGKKLASTLDECADELAEIMELYGNYGKYDESDKKRLNEVKASALESAKKFTKLAARYLEEEKDKEYNPIAEGDEGEEAEQDFYDEASESIESLDEGLGFNPRRLPPKDADPLEEEGVEGLERMRQMREDEEGEQLEGFAQEEDKFDEGGIVEGEEEFLAKDKGKGKKKGKKDEDEEDEIKVEVELEEKEEDEDKDEDKDKDDEKGKDKEEDADDSCPECGLTQEACICGGSPDENAEDTDGDMAEKFASNHKRRMKIAAATEKFFDLSEAHPGGGTKVDFDMKPQNDADKVETIIEQHQKIRDVADQSVPKVRMSEEKTSKKPTAQSAKSEAAKYYGELYGKGDAESKSFAKELTAAAEKDKIKKDGADYRDKLRRAYAVAFMAQEKGMIPDGVDAVHRQVDDIMDFDDKAFDAYKRSVANSIRADRQVKISSGTRAVEFGQTDLPEEKISNGEALKIIFNEGSGKKTLKV